MLPAVESGSSEAEGGLPLLLLWFFVHKQQTTGTTCVCSAPCFTHRQTRMPPPQLCAESLRSDAVQLCCFTADQPGAHTLGRATPQRATPLSAPLSLKGPAGTTTRPQPHHPLPQTHMQPPPPMWVAHCGAPACPRQRGRPCPPAAWCCAPPPDGDPTGTGAGLLGVSASASTACEREPATWYDSSSASTHASAASASSATK